MQQNKEFGPNFIFSKTSHSHLLTHHSPTIHLSIIHPFVHLSIHPLSSHPPFHPPNTHPSSVHPSINLSICLSHLSTSHPSLIFFLPSLPPSCLPSFFHSPVHLFTLCHHLGNPSNTMFIYPSIGPFVLVLYLGYLSNMMPIHLPILSSIHLTIRPNVCPPIHPSIHLSPTKNTYQTAPPPCFSFPRDGGHITNIKLLFLRYPSLVSSTHQSPENPTLTSTSPHTPILLI